MPSYETVPCLLFLAADEVFGDANGLELENVSVQPQIKGYALLLRAFENNHQEVIEGLSRNNIQVISDCNFEVSPEMAAKEFIMFDGALSAHSPEKEAMPDSPPTFVYVWRKIGKTATSADLQPANDIRILRVYEYYELLCLKNNLAEPFAVLANSRSCIPPFSDETLKAIEHLLLQTKDIKCGLCREPLVNFAVRSHQVGLLKLLLRNGIGLPHGEVYDWSSVLETAIVTENFFYVKQLLKYLCLNVSDFTGSIPLFTLLWTAFTFKGRQSCKALFELATTVPVIPLTSDNVDRLLRAAAFQGWPDVLQLILGFGPAVTDLFNLTTFDLAEKKCRRLMKKYGFKSDSVVEDLNPLLCDALLRDRVEVVKNLVENGNNVNGVFKYNNTWFRHNSNKKLKKLQRPDPFYGFISCKMDAGLDALCSFRGYYTPLHMAAACGGEAVIKLLLELGADVNAEVEKRTPIYDAILTDNWDAVKLLIANGANVRNKPELVNFAVARGRLDIVELLLVNRSTFSIEESELQKLLSIAAVNRRTEVIECLFKFGVKVDAEFNIDSSWDIRERRNRESDTRRLADVMQALLDHGFMVVDFMTAVRIGSLDYEDDTETDFFMMSIRHYMKLKSAKLLSDEGKVPARIDFYQALSGFQNNCDAKVVKLKSERIGNSNGTFFDVLTASITKLARYARHPDFKEIMGTKDYENQFPIYASVLKCQFEKGMHRRKLLDRGSEICSLLSEKFKKFPDLVKEEIIQHLSNYNLEVLKYEFDQYAASSDEN